MTALPTIYITRYNHLTHNDLGTFKIPYLCNDKIINKV